MNDQIKLDRLAELFSQLERGWLDNQNRQLVYQLSGENPDLQEELFEFFEDLVLEAEEQPVAESVLEAEDRVHQWLLSAGSNIAHISRPQTPCTTSLESVLGVRSSPPEVLSRTEEEKLDEPSQGSKTESWLLHLRRCSKKTVPQIASQFENVTTEFLVLVSRHPRLVPAKGKIKLAQDAERVCGVPVDDSRQFLEMQPALVRAASRSQPFEKEAQTFEELLDRAALSREQRAFWLQFK